MSINASPSMSQVAAAFGGSAPHSLSEYYGVTFSDGGSAPNTGAISLNNFRNKTPAPAPGEVGGGVTWTHIAVPHYGGGLQNVWRINPRVGTNTSLFSHGPPIPFSEWPTKIRLNEGYLTPTQWYDLTGGGNPASHSNPRPVGVRFVDPFWTKTTNQTT